MKFTPEQYSIADEPQKPYIDVNEIWSFLDKAVPTNQSVEQIVSKSLNKNRLNLEEVATLVQANTPDQIEIIKSAARKLKEKVYGKRIVLFASLYVGNLCMNNCEYCGFKASNKNAVRKTLGREELIKNVEALEKNGQKRLILVYGEHPRYTPEYIANTVKTVYSVKTGNGEIRRVNINAAPLSIEGFKTVKDSGIGTYQIFQETYHPEAYKIYHKSGRKADFDNRLVSLDRAQEAGLDDVGIGALFGLYDWRFEVMGLVRQTNHLEACYNVGPHTISFPRLTDAAGFKVNPEYAVSDEEFTRIIAILRLAVPYTGMILTAREPMHIRKEVLRYGCSQVDAGTKIEMGAYSETDHKEQDLNQEQFLINDDRSLSEVIDELIEGDYLPSFCTACYRKGRTGEHFMEFSVPGFIKRFCTPNAILTLAEYIIDYAKDDTAIKGWKLIEKNIGELNEPKLEASLRMKIDRVRQGERDIYY